MKIKIIIIIILLTIIGILITKKDNILVLKTNDKTPYSCKLSNENINIEGKINNIVSNNPNFSSNPYDYIRKNQKEYNELLNYPKETFEYAIKDLIETNAGNGLKSYIEALLCYDINDNFKTDFVSANDFLEKYKEFLTKSYSIFNEYDRYALSLLNS